MISSANTNPHATPEIPRGNELNVLIQHAHKLRAQATGRIMRKLFGLAPIEHHSNSFGEPLPKEG